MDDISAKKIISLYERHAETWDNARRNQSYECGWLDQFLALIPENGRILDIGCGAGKPVAEYFIDRKFSVTGIDASAPMIAISRERFPEQRWEVADMRTLSLNEKFDGLIAWDSFFHLTRSDQKAMLAVFEKHAKPAAALMFTSGPANGEAIGTFEGEALYHASLAPEEYRELFAQHGFREVNMVAEDPTCGGHTVWLATSRQS
ncbi:SAM-dependent methyltransferase [Rahnella sp. AA]|uniref:class I SAM-dependent DNA methyltransferase n=1 Tax=Rahnella sp. AA TaxID=2057180 RepID=UPI000C3207FD|nr:class I SAM-dependent methyltransferase [Rahnella sp. AA]PKE28033.1 SAM-dependent methyltransferase [Rahnella sp. AA]